MGAPEGAQRPLNRGGKQTVYVPMPTCLEYCQYFGNGGWVGDSQGSAIHSKCFAGISPKPLNGVRLLLVSQIGTTDYDPSLQKNNGSFNDCYSMLK